MKHNENK